MDWPVKPVHRAFCLGLCSEKDMLAFSAVGVKLSRTRKKLVATANRREGVLGRTGEPSVTFCERGDAVE